MAFPLLVLASGVVCLAAIAASLWPSRPRWLAAGAGFTSAIALLFLQGPGFFRFFSDDSYITFRYAQHLADGLGPNWNSDGRVEGYTNFLWMLIMTGPAKLGLDLVDVSRVLGVLSVVATYFIIYKIWRLWSDEVAGSGAESPLLFVTVLLTLSLAGGVAFWAFSGLETVFFMALLTGGAYLHLVEQRGSVPPWSAAVFAAAAVTRPEGVIAAAVTGAFILVRLGGAPDRRQVLFRALSWGALFLLLYGTYFLWRYSYYDYLLPNTFYAKVGPTSASLDRGLEYIASWGLRYLLVVMIPAACVLFTQPRLRRDTAYILTLAAALLAVIVYEGGDDFPHGRFLVPLLPLLYLAGLSGTAILLRRLPLEPALRGSLAALAMSAGALLLLQASLHNSVPIEIERRALPAREAFGQWLRLHTPPDYTIGAFAVGAIAYHSDRDVLDLLGINDVTIAHADVPDFGAGIAGHEKYDVDYVFDEAQPEILIPFDVDTAPQTREQMRERFKILSPVEARNQILNDSRLWLLYDVRSVNIGEGRWFNFLQRKDTIPVRPPATLSSTD